MSKLINSAKFYDTDNKYIQAHGSKIYYFNHVYYWIGENKELTDGVNGVWHNGVNAYISEDFIHWKYAGNIIKANDNEDSTLNRKSKMDRPHLLYNKKYNYFVMWLKIQNDDGRQDITILKSKNILGPYKIIKEHYHPFDFSTGDFDLVIENGNAYWFYEMVHNGLAVSLLDDTYLSALDYTILEDNTKPPYTREAPVYFTWNNRHFLVTSGTTSYFSNPSKIYELESITGPIINRYNSHLNDVKNNSFNSQISGVVEVNDKLLFVADTWYPNNSISYETIEDIFSLLFSEKKEEAIKEVSKIQHLLPKDNTRDSEYLFYELTIQDNNPYFEYKKEIDIK